MNTGVKQRRVLVLARAGTNGEAVVSRLEGEVHSRLVNSIEEAISALADDDFDLVVSERDDFLELQVKAVNQQAATILESIGQGVCIVDLGGHPIWMNPQMRVYSEDVIKKVCSTCLRAFGQGGEVDPAKPAYHRARRVSLAAADDQYFEVTITPMTDHDGRLTQLVAAVWDVTHGRRLQKKIGAIEAAGRELVRLDTETMAELDTEARVDLLEQKMLAHMHAVLQFDNFAVLLIDRKTQRLEIVLQHGMSESTRTLDLYASPESNGISGFVAATGRSYICHDTSKDPRYLPGLECARSSLSVPLRLHDQVIGVLDIESDLPAAFNEDDRQFAEIFAGYVALSLNLLDLLVVERYKSTGQFANDVSGEIAGPLNDIISEATGLMEEYIGNDDLRRRLGAIVDCVAEIKQSLKEVATPRAGILGRCTEESEHDPLLAGKRVLVADDEEIIRETVGGVLRKYGCEVETAGDGIQAIKLLGQRAYDLVLADIKMPHKNGYEVFAAARDKHGNLPVILMTGFGYDPNHSIVRARREGLSAVLFKPFKVDQLLSEVRSAFQVK